ncbi:hypothetical protein PV682_41285 [Streptomyces niveiscabiei]|uniref:hypothetical protein n=1 Tax=Streptomyces niveiscabiei TaxID=164115 RepID=UPI0029B992DA|nr:hypothetical protein [Streptomyces niveiscabiei]MDX3387833.1 hypothetical protein [Streptomyces niveiscabiei]
MFEVGLRPPHDAEVTYRHFEDPKPGYVAGWGELPEWQWETDADIFEAVEGV